MEKWADLNFNGITGYQVSSDGRVRNKKTGRILKKRGTSYSLQDRFGDSQTHSVGELLSEGFRGR